jgi:hypothetical protein
MTTTFSRALPKRAAVYAMLLGLCAFAFWLAEAQPRPLATPPDYSASAFAQLRVYERLLAQAVIVEPNSMVGRNAHTQLVGLYRPEHRRRHSISKSFEQQLDARDRARCLYLLSLAEAVRDPLLTAELLDSYVYKSPPLSDTPDENERVTQLHFALSDSFCRLFERADSGPAVDVLREHARHRPMNLGVRILPAQAFLWLRLDGLRAIVEMNLAKETLPHLRAIDLYALRGCDGGAAVRSALGALDGRPGSVALTQRVVEAAFMAMTPELAAVFLRLWANQGEIAHTLPFSVLDAVNRITSTNEGRKLQRRILEACIEELQFTESDRERRALAVAAFSAASEGVTVNAARRLQVYLRAPTTGATAARESVARATLMNVLAVGAHFGSEELLEWAEHAVEVEDYGVAYAGLRLIRYKGSLTGYFRSGIARERMTRLLGDILEWKPEKANRHLLVLVVEFVERGRFDELVPRVVEIASANKHKWMKPFVDAVQRLDKEYSR